VIDIGSNSGRVVVFRVGMGGHLSILAGSRAPLRLVHDVDEKHNLTEEAMGRTMEALRDFRALAVGAGARRIVAVATAALRDADNGDVLVERIRRELRIRVEIIDARREAYYGFMGAVRGLPVEAGLFFDVGGGSLQLTRFRRRRMDRALSFPLGALRLSETFLLSDPPRSSEIRRLRNHVRKLLSRAKIARLRKGQALVGTGGTLRNLAKIASRTHPYPIGRVHGYVLEADRLREIVAALSSTPLRRRESIKGLSDERGDSIVGGALAIETLVELVQAKKIIVSGQGVREGVAYSLLSETMTPARDARDASIATLTSLFGGWNPEPAERRRAIAATLLKTLQPRATRELSEALDYAAWVLDIGRSIDFFDRHEHVADVLLATHLDGFTHEEIALTAAVLRRAGEKGSDLKRLKPLLAPDDHDPIERAAVLLSLADDIEERCPPGAPVGLSCTAGRRVTVRVPSLPAWRSRGLGKRFERAFGKPLEVIPGG
jgi:exopolyphosphatase/guanosine-5'-triphosphate,3'-diphosphate pyrophosphatase